ncbi:hypothetical protein CLAFUW4_09211 [Fulvia fulva]|nr:hypothetical protein CLAFUR4_09217 [Fulvia fulva]KAK4614480.1 hypothetical protein CLAFUR0_09209 [Fulvia fulva]WPV20175.1 hypothetical protein CLAFUW4_09211 [Fulvia fulva]WPV35554.1 hypothetical protein CLAFUW7_09212 [Fulvia fulva]
MAESNTVKDIRAVAKAELLQAHPNIPIAAMEELLDSVVADTEKVIKKQDPIAPCITFFTLPNELRTRIYRLIVTFSPYSTLSAPLLIHGDIERLLDTDFVFPAILHTSQQMRQEAQEVYYGRNKFVVELGYDFLTIEDFDIPEVLEWMKVVGRERVKMIKYLEFNIRVSPDVDRPSMSLAMCQKAKASPAALDLSKPVEKWNKDVFLNALPLVKMGVSMKVIKLVVEKA